MRTELAIAGAGPAGLAVAIHARLRGLSAVVFERRRPPLDKPCGEGVMPLGVAELRALGVALPPGCGAPFAGIRFVDGELRAQGRFGSGPGLGLRRTALSAALLARAEALGVELRFGETVTGWSALGAGRVRVRTSGGGWEAGLLVAADGLHSRLRRAAGLALPARGRLRHGMRRHYRVSDSPDCVEVHWADGVEAYLTPIGGGELGVALLFDEGAPPRWDALLARLPRLARRLAGAEPSSRLEGAARFRQRVRRRTAPGLALVGDAAGYLDALTGEGVTLGLRCARALVDALAEGEPLDAYERAWRSLTRSYFVVTSALLEVAARPRLRRRVVGALARDPALFDRLLAIDAGEAPLSALGAGGAWALAAGLLRGPQSGESRPSAFRVTSTKRSTRKMKVL